MHQEPESWVVYLMTIHKLPEGRRAVCAQHEWEEMERARPGYHQLLHAGISSESEAERLARGDAANVKATPRWRLPR
jgi:hypothetical protein